MAQGQKVKKESPGESPRESPGVRGPPQKESKTSLQEILRQKLTCLFFFCSRDSFLTFFGGSAGTPRDSLGDFPEDSSSG